MENKRRPTKASIVQFLLEASRGFEPLNEGFADPCLTTWPRRHFKELSGRWDSNPRPSPWQGDVLPLYYARISWPIFLTESAETQDRTGDTAIFSRVLYQLSYLGKSILLLSVRDFTR